MATFGSLDILGIGMATVVRGDVPHPLAPGRPAEGIPRFALSNATEQTWNIDGGWPVHATLRRRIRRCGPSREAAALAAVCRDQRRE